MTQMPIYAWYTILTVVTAYVIFAISSCVRGKWYYAFSHPYAFTCCVMLLAYRYASEIPSISVHADRITAIGFIWASAVFWCGYNLIRTKHIDRVSVRLLPPHEETDSINRRKLWAFSIYLVILLLGYIVVMYVKCGSMDYLIGTVYKLEYNQRALAGEFAAESLCFKGIQYLFRNTIWVLPYAAVALLFAILRKQKKAHGILLTISVFLLTFFIFNFVPLSIGSRAMFICIIGSSYLMVLASFLFSSRHLSLIAIPILMLLVLSMVFWILTVQTIRNYGFAATFVGPRNVFSSVGIGRAIASATGTVENQTVPQYMIDTGNDFYLTIPPNGDSGTDTPTSLVSLTKVDTVTQKVDAVTQKVDTDTQKSVVMSGVSHNEESDIPSSEWIAADRARQQHLQAMELEKNFLLTYKYSHSKSKEMAWALLWFGRHRDYLGFFYQLKHIAYNIFPYQSKPEDRVPSVGHIVHQDRGYRSLTGSIVGPFGDGYACYGYVGGFFYWGLYALFGGMFARFSVYTLYTASPRLELTVLSLGLQMHIFVMMTSHVSVITRFLTGYTIFFMIWLIAYGMLRKCTAQTTMIDN